MKRLCKKRELISMDLTPLIDVVFLLLIFFIVASEFKKNETILNLSLPNSASKENIVEKKAIVIELSEKKLAYKTSEIDFVQLEQKLSLLQKDSQLTVKIDKEVKYKRVVKLLDILNKLQLSNLLLITKSQ
ncbi:MAG: ExbD/TolR family protein [Poseidonibacter sp.]|uniref:ExbD/TolR family protein n=1 Tax=Poseidonibacter sp. TaxID=2321188 RepID=UPI00359E9C09